MARTNRLVGLMGTDHTSVVCSLSNLDISQGASAPILRGVEFKMWSSGTLYDGYCCTSESVCLRCLSLLEPDSSTQQLKSSPEWVVCTNFRNDFCHIRLHVTIDFHPVVKWFRAWIQRWHHNYVSTYVLPITSSSAV